MPAIDPRTAKYARYQDDGNFERQSAGGDNWGYSRAFPSSSAVSKPTTSAKARAKAKGKVSRPVVYKEDEIPVEDDYNTDDSLDSEFAYLLEDFDVPWPSIENHSKHEEAQEDESKKKQNKGKGNAKGSGRAYGQEKTKAKKKEEEVHERQESDDDDDDIPTLVSPAVSAELEGKQPETKPYMQERIRDYGNGERTHLYTTEPMKCYTPEEKNKMTQLERTRAEAREAFYRFVEKEERGCEKRAMRDYMQGKSSRKAPANKNLAITSK